MSKVAKMETTKVQYLKIVLKYSFSVSYFPPLLFSSTLVPLYLKANKDIYLIKIYLNDENCGNPGALGCSFISLSLYLETSTVPVTGSGKVGSGPQAAKTIIWLLLGVRSRPSANNNNSLISRERGGESSEGE